MRITISDGYGHKWNACDVLDDCQRHYCHTHRLLWRDCDTAKPGMDDTYLNGRPHYVYDLGDCPACERDLRHREAQREQERLERNFEIHYDETYDFKEVSNG